MKISNTCEDANKLDISKLAEPFVKGDNSRSGRNGSGLGLSNVKTTVERLGLKMKIDVSDGMFIVEIRQ